MFYKIKTEKNKNNIRKIAKYTKIDVPLQGIST